MHSTDGDVVEVCVKCTSSLACPMSLACWMSSMSSMSSYLGALAAARPPTRLVLAPQRSRGPPQPVVCSDSTQNGVRMACAKGVSRGGVPPEHQPAVAAARRRGGRTLRGLSEPVGGEGSSRKLILPDLEPCTFRVGSSGSRATGPEGARRTRPGRPTEPRSGLRHARWAG